MNCNGFWWLGWSNEVKKIYSMMIQNICIIILYYASDTDTEIWWSCFEIVLVGSCLSVAYHVFLLDLAMLAGADSCAWMSVLLV